MDGLRLVIGIVIMCAPEVMPITLCPVGVKESPPMPWHGVNHTTVAFPLELTDIPSLALVEVMSVAGRVVTVGAAAEMILRSMAERAVINIMAIIHDANLALFI